MFFYKNWSVFDPIYNNVGGEYSLFSLVECFFLRLKTEFKMFFRNAYCQTIITFWTHAYLQVRTRNYWHDFIWVDGQFWLSY